MFRKLTFLVGLGTGYVLGAKAGEQRYQQIVDKAREIAGMPAVKEAASTLTDAASSAASTVGDKAASAASTVSDKAKSTLGGSDSAPATVDLNGSNGSTSSPAKAPSTTTTTIPSVKPATQPATSGITTSKAPMTGATASGSAPVVKTP